MHGSGSHLWAAAHNDKVQWSCLASFLICEQLHAMNNISNHSLNIKTELLTRFATLYSVLHLRPGGNTHTQTAASMGAVHTSENVR